MGKFKEYMEYTRIFEGHPLSSIIFSFPQGFPIYIFKFLLPLKLCADPYFRVYDSLNYITLFHLFVFFAALFFGFFLWRRNRIISFGIFWSIIFYLPVSGIIPVVCPLAERYAYFIIPGFIIVLGELIKKRRYLVPVVVYILFLVVFNIYRSRDWRDEYILWSKTVECNPFSYIGYNNLGIILERRGDFVNAILCYEKAIKIRKDYSSPYVNLGNIEFKRGNLSGAEKYYRNAIKNDPGNVKAYFNLGVVMMKRKMYNSALDCFYRALDINPYFLPALINAANIEYHFGDRKKAMDLIKRALSIDPENPLVRKTVMQFDNW